MVLYYTIIKKISLILKRQNQYSNKIISLISFLLLVLIFLKILLLHLETMASILLKWFLKKVTYQEIAADNNLLGYLFLHQEKSIKSLSIMCLLMVRKIKHTSCIFKNKKNNNSFNDSINIKDMIAIKQKNQKYKKE